MVRCQSCGTASSDWTTVCTTPLLMTMHGPSAGNDHAPRSNQRLNVEFDIENAPAHAFTHAT